MKYTDPRVADNVLNPQLIARINREYMTYFQPGWKSTSRADEGGHNQYNILGDTKYINIDCLLIDMLFLIFNIARHSVILKSSRINSVLDIAQLLI